MAWNRTASNWRSASKNGKFWRSSEFNAIETAIGKYKTTDPDDQRLSRLKAILDAISVWRVTKQEAKAKTAGVAFVSPRTQRDTGDKIAASEDKLRDVGVLTDKGESLSVRSAATEQLVREVVDEIDEVMNLARSQWGGHPFTNPADHLQDNFRYLVSAQSESKEIVPHREQAITNPGLIADALISASVITDDSVHIWGPSGFILDAPAKCVGVAKNDDFKTRNAVAEGHLLEKYREILRLYESGVRLPAPTNLRVETNKHNEVAVLGRSFGNTTKVVGVFVLVDQVATTVATIRPASIYRLAGNLMHKTTNATTYIIESEEPSVTDRRMGQFRTLNRDLNLPIVQILMSAAVEIGATYWGNMYDGDFMFPRPALAFEHGSREHLQAVASKNYRPLILKSGHSDKCPVCFPEK
jgi:hypothetical protein